MWKILLLFVPGLRTIGEMRVPSFPYTLVYRKYQGIPQGYLGIPKVYREIEGSVSWSIVLNPG